MSLVTSGTPLRELIAAVDAFEDTRLVAEALAREGAQLVLAGFGRSRAPDGSPWDPLKRPRFGLGGPLWRSGELREMAGSPVVSADGFVMTSTHYGKVHQEGSSRRGIPARKFFPDPLPASWERTMDRAAGDAIKTP